MGSDADTSVCDPHGAVRGVENLFLADASILPTSVGVNPMMTVIACATHVAGDVGAALSG
jgi:choline dehydrogenase-like flavoprotein